MILRELMEQVNGEKEKGQIGKEQLKSVAGEPIASDSMRMGANGALVSIQVFGNGYVLYEEDGKCTVFHLSDIRGKGKEYETVKESFGSKKERTVPDEVYMNEDWKLRLLLEGNERIQHNQEKRESDHVQFHYSEYSEDMKELGYEPELLEELLNEIKKEEGRRVIEAVRASMKPAQWKIYRSFDWGYRRPFSVGWWAVDYDGVVYRILEMAVSKEYCKAKAIVEELRELLRKYADD